MADSSNSLNGSVGLDTTAFKTGVAQLTQSIRDIETNFRASAAVMGDWSNTSDGLKERVSSLGDKLDLQKQKLSTLREQFVTLQNAEGDNSKAMASIASQMSTVERAIGSTQSQIDKYSTALKESESPAAGLQEKLNMLSQQIQLSASKFNVTASAMGDWASRSDGLRSKLDSLRESESLQKQQVSELESVYSQIIQKEGENSSAATSMAIKLNDARAAFEKTGSDIRTFSSDLSAAESKENEQNTALGKLKSAFSDMGSKAQSSGSGISNMFSGLKSTIAGFAGGMAASLSWNTLISATDSAEKSAAQMEAVLKSTGGAAGMTSNQLNDLATSQAKVTTFSAGTTKQAENMLLTFTNIKSNVFPQTIKASENMATAMGMSATDAAKTLGKALNDPADGLSKLTKQGVTFTDAQKQQIDAMVKSGNTAGAQTVMLQELEKEFGGSAKAAGSTLTGQTQIMENNLKSAGVQIVTSLMPIAQTVIPMITQGAQNIAKEITAHKSEIQGAVKEVTAVIKDIFGFVATHGPLIKGIVIGIGGAFLAFKAISGIIAGITTAIKIWQGVTKAFTAVQAALNFVMSANPIGIIVLAIAGLVAAFVILFNKCKPFHDFVMGAFTAFKSALITVKNAIAGFFTGVANFFKQWGPLILTFVAPFIGIPLLIMQHWGQISAFFASMGKGIKAVFNGIGTWLKSVFKGAADGIKTAFGAVVGFFSGIVSTINGFFALIGRFIVSMFQSSWNNTVSIWNGIVGFFQNIWNGIVAIFNVVGSWFASVFGAAWSGIQAIWNTVVGFFQGVWSGISNIFSSIGNWFKDRFNDAVNGIKGAWSGVAGFFSGIWNGISGVFGSIGSWFSDKFNEAKNAITSIFKPDMLTNIGHQLIEGLWNGINNAVDWIKGKLEGFKDAVMGALKSFFGIHSPSTLFRDEIGKNLALGIGEGFSGNITAVSEKMKNSMKGISSSVSSGIQVSYKNVQSASSALSGGFQSEISPAIAGGYGQSNSYYSSSTPVSVTVNAHFNGTQSNSQINQHANTIGKQTALQIAQQLNQIQRDRG
ncbi:MAG: phage tail length tape measure family protein [Ethanoligenens sp.]